MEDNSQVRSQVSKLVDGTIDELKNYIVDKDRGYIHSLIIFLENIYTKLSLLKDEYINRAGVAPEDLALSYDEALKKVYAELFKIEGKIIFLTDYEKQLRIEDNSNLTNS